MKKKLIPLLLCVSLLAGCLAGCGSKPAEVTIEESPAPTETPAPTPTETSTPAPEESADPEAAARATRYRAAYETYAPDQTVMLVNGEPVTWGEYYSWIYDIASRLESEFAITDWNAPREEVAALVPDSTFGSYVRKTALGYAVQIAVVGQKARELGVELTEQQRSDVQAMLDGYAERFGGQEALEQLLSDSYISMDYFRRQNETMFLIDDIYESLYGPDGENLPDEDVISYLKDNGYLYAKHILFRTVDDERNALSEEEIAQKKAQAEEVLAQLKDCPAEDLPERFDALMRELSEDTGVAAYPDGYYFRAGEMVPAFEETVRTLEENGMSDLVESDYGYHIVYCPPMDANHLMGYDSNRVPYTTKAFVSAALFNNTAQGWFTEAEQNVQYVNSFDALDFNALFQITPES